MLQELGKKEKRGRRGMGYVFMLQSHHVVSTRYIERGYGRREEEEEEKQGGDV